MSQSQRRPLMMIAAMNQDRIIGKDGDLPWRIPEDLKHFKRETKGHAIIMGRKTWDERGKPLPKRRNIVVSRSWTEAPEGAELARSLEEAMEMAWETDEEPRIIGGGGIYRAALPYATRMVLTFVEREVEGGDTTFPEWDESEWVETERRVGEDPTVVYVTYVRRDDD